VLSPRMERKASLNVIRAVLARVPSLKGLGLENVDFERLSGAMTNVSYKLSTDAGDYVLRLAGEGTSDYVDRTAEGHNARVAAAAGVNAEVLYFDAREGTMLTRFVEGVSMEGEGFDRDPGTPARVAAALKRVHGIGRVFRSRFDVFATIDGYLDLLHAQRMPLPEDYQEVGREVEAVRRALEASPVPLAPCHNDPWPGNLLDTGGSIYIIDWEYSGMNDPMWDLGDLSVEAGFGPEQDQAMMETYHGGAPPAALLSRLMLYKAMSDFHWSLWSMVQHANDNPAEDFWTYALMRLERCKARIGSADFGWHLAATRGSRRSTRLQGCLPHRYGVESVSP
jgi:thiamine kinase-like enzyme